MFEINCHGECMPRPKIEPLTPNYRSDALLIQPVGWVDDSCLYLHFIIKQVFPVCTDIFISLRVISYIKFLHDAENKGNLAITLF